MLVTFFVQSTLVQTGASAREKQVIKVDICLSDRVARSTRTIGDIRRLRQILAVQASIHSIDFSHLDPQSYLLRQYLHSPRRAATDHGLQEADVGPDLEIETCGKR
jgi:hypothetical protein